MRSTRPSTRTEQSKSAEAARSDGASAISPIKIEQVDAADLQRLGVAVWLGNQGRKTLGLMPASAYPGFAEKGGLILATVDGTPVGYALFEVATKWIRMVHLYVVPAARNSGIARELVDWIGRAHRDRQGIKVTSRLDHGLGEFWAGLGFVRRSEGPGRGKDRATLVVWWRDHHHRGLFARDVSGALVRAAVDLNIVRDWIDPDRPNHEESLALTIDSLADQLVLVRTPPLDMEIDGLGDNLRKDCTRRIEGLEAIEADPRREREARQALERTLDSEPAGSHDIAAEDVRYVSHAIGSGLDALVTRDESAARVLGPTAALYGLRILSPSDVIVRLDELGNSASYRPQVLLATDFRERKVGSGDSKSLEVLQSRETGEGAGTFRQRIRQLTARGYTRMALEDDDGSVVAGYLARVSPPGIDVGVLRVLNHPLRETLASQLLFRLRQLARDERQAVVRISDPHVSHPIGIAAGDDGFIRDNAGLYAFVIDSPATAGEVEHATATAARNAGLEPPMSLRSPLSSSRAAAIERSWWPAKLIDSPLPTYVVPIRQAFASQLLGVSPGLFSRPAALGLSRDHVYYRRAGTIQPEAPARILWYVSQSKVEPAGIVAASRLDAVVEGPADELHSRFAHLGVWERDQVLSAARDGRLQAIRFSDTELFPRRLDLAAVRELIKTPPIGPRRITSNQFAAAYRAGFGIG